MIYLEKYDIALVTDYRRYLGFRLGSYSNIYFVSTIEEGNALLKKLFSEKKFGLILVSSNVFDSDNEEIKFLRKKSFPLLVEIPISGKDIAVLQERKIMEFLRKSIGYSIKF